MPQSSSYSDEHVEQMLSELINVLEEYRTLTDLSLMVMGNMVTNLINTSVAPVQWKTLVRSFSEALQASAREDEDKTY